MKSTLDSREFKYLQIPRSIWFSNLSLIEKCLLAEIESLSSKGKGCFASNEYLSEFMGVTEAGVKKIIGRLRAYGLIKTIKFDGRYRILALNKPKIEELPERVLKNPLSSRGSQPATPEVADEPQNYPVKNELKSLEINDLQKAIPLPILKYKIKDKKEPVPSLRSVTEEASESDSSKPPNLIPNREAVASSATVPKCLYPTANYNVMVFVLWKQKMGGAPLKSNLKAIKELCGEYGLPTVEKAFKWYLSNTDALYISLPSFCSKFGMYLQKAGGKELTQAEKDERDAKLYQKPRDQTVD